MVDKIKVTDWANYVVPCQEKVGFSRALWWKKNFPVIPYRNCTFLNKFFLKTSKLPNKKGTFDANLVFTATLACTKMALLILWKKLGGGGHVPPVPRFLRPWQNDKNVLPVANFVPNDNKAPYRVQASFSWQILFARVYGKNWQFFYSLTRRTWKITPYFGIVDNLLNFVEKLVDRKLVNSSRKLSSKTCSSVRGI